MPLLAEGEFALVRHHLETALRISDTEHGDHDLYASLADAAAQQRDAAALGQYLPATEELALRHSHRLYQGIAHRSWGVAHRLAGDVAAAESRMLRALDIFVGLDTRWQIGRTLHELGELAAARADAAAAGEYFARALTEFEHLRAVPAAARTRAALETLV